jgi:glyceraldehyde 3-phosphate dehydrogenase
MKILSTGINGFGRFGLHLLKYWLDRSNESNFTVNYINDDFLTPEEIYSLILNDEYVIFNKYKIQLSSDNHLNIIKPTGEKFDIKLTHSDPENLDWLGKPDFFLECSGKRTVAEENGCLLKEKTKLVIVSATSWDIPKTLVYGFNHEEYDISDTSISYGSCTVNAYVPLAKYMFDKYEYPDSDVNVVHNVAEHKLENTLIRKFCTLEKSAQQFFSFLNDDNFVVNYTVVPYTGVSMIDFRFRMPKEITLDDFLSDFEESITDGPLKGLYGMDEVDIGPEVHNCTTFSTNFIKENIKLVGDNLYMHGYFDTENSVNRYFDLVNFISKKHQ